MTNLCRFARLTSLLRASVLNTRSGCQSHWALPPVSTLDVHKEYQVPIQIREYSKITPKHQRWQIKSIDDILLKIERKMVFNNRIDRIDIDDMMKCLEKCESVSANYALSIIKSFGSMLVEEAPAERMRLVKLVWQRLQQMDCGMNILHYNALLRVFNSNHHNFTPANFLESLHDAGLDPDADTYHMLIVHYCSKGDMNGAKEMLSIMSEKGMPIDTSVLNTLILGYGEARDLDAARAQLENMKAASENVSRRTIVCLLLAYAKNGKIDVILDEIQSYLSEGINFNQSDYLNVMYELCSHGHASMAPSILPLLKDAFGRDPLILNGVVRLMHLGAVDVGYQLLMTMSSRTEEVFLDMVKFFVRHLWSSGCSAETCLQYCEELQRQTGRDEHYFNFLMSYAKVASIDDQLEILRKMKARSIPLDVILFRPLMECSADKDHFDLLHLMVREFELVPSAVFIRECVLPNIDMSQPMRVLFELRKAHVKKYASVSSVVFECLRRNLLRDAVKITSTHQTFLHPKLYYRVLVDALIATDDYEAFAQFVRNLALNYQHAKTPTGMDRQEVDGAVVAGKLLYDAMSKFGSEARIANTHKVLEEFHRLGVSIDASEVEKIRRDFARELTANLLTLLEEHASGKLKLVQNKRPTLTSDVTTEKYNREMKKRIDSIVKTDAVRALEEAINVRNIERMKQRFYALNDTDDFVSISTYTMLVERFVTANEHDIARDVLVKVLQKGLFVPGLTKILKVLADAGQVESLTTIERELSSGQKHKVDFLPILSIAYCVANRGEELLDQLNERFQNSGNDFSVSYWSATFPARRLFHLMAQEPHLESKLQSMAEQWASKGVYNPMWIFWWRAILAGHEDASRKIYVDHLQKVENPPKFGQVLSTARERCDPRPVQILIDQFKLTPAHHQELPTFYKCLIAIQCDNQRYDEALSTLNETLKHLKLADIDYTLLERIKKGLESDKKEFPYKIVKARRH